jgi:hypothetical protein
MIGFLTCAVVGLNEFAADVFGSWVGGKCFEDKKWQASVGAKGRRVMVLECESLKDEVIDARHDSIVASVVWQDQKLLEIFLIRRSDMAISRLAVPFPLKGPLANLNCEAVRRHALSLNNVVVLGLMPTAFRKDANFGARSLRDGMTPAWPGSLRVFKPGLIGIDIGEYKLPRPDWFN